MEEQLKKYQVIFVDEYNNWYLIGFFDDLKEAEPSLNSYLEGYLAYGEDDEEEVWQPQFGDDKPLKHLHEYPSTLGSCFDRIIDTTCGAIQIRGFIYR